MRLGIFRLSSIIYLQQIYWECERRQGLYPPCTRWSSLVNQYFNTDLWTLLKLMIMEHIKIIQIPIFYWDSLHARLNSHYKTWSYKKRSTKRLKHNGQSANAFFWTSASYDQLKSLVLESRRPCASSNTVL